jgi:hypothetical protein
VAVADDEEVVGLLGVEGAQDLEGDDGHVLRLVDDDGAVARATLQLLQQLDDVGVAIVPGFVGMSRAGTNAELRALRAGVDGLPPGYFAVTGDFEPTDPTWKFWRGWQARIANGLADRVFDGPNDLVVDVG